MMTSNSFKTTTTLSLELSYLTYFPKDYDENSTDKYPLLLFLHGMGQIGENLQDLYDTGLPKNLAQGQDLPFIILMPQCPPNSFWTEESQALKALVDHTVRNLPIDETKVYITGLSMGGYGTYEMLIRYPHTFAAGIPICGGIGTLFSKIQLLNLKDQPLWIFHGELDSVVSVQESKDIIKALELVHSKDLNYTLYPNLDHDSWTKTYENPEIYRFLLRNKLNKRE